MKSAIQKRVLLAEFFLGLALSLTGCGESLKSEPEGNGPAGPPPKTEAEYRKNEQARLKAIQPPSKTSKPAR